MGRRHAAASCHAGADAAARLAPATDRALDGEAPAAAAAAGQLVAGSRFESAVAGTGAAAGQQDGTSLAAVGGKTVRTTKSRRVRSGQKQQGQQQQQPSGQVSGPANHASKKPPVVKSTEDEIMAAIRSLYDDQLQPYGRILRKRLEEHSVAAGLGLVQIDANHLREACEANQALFTEPVEGGEWFAVLRGVPPTFVDVYSTADPYPQELWEALEAFFSRPEWADASLPGGRYSCAQTLGGHQLAFLAGYSLGQVCHIVQLAISTRKVLGYFKGATVPYSRSQSMLKQSCAEMQRPCLAGPSALGDGDVPQELPFATWPIAREHLKRILKDASAAGRHSVPISNVKGLFRSDCQTELSETKLGHHKLTDLLKDERLCDICAVQLQEQGYVLVAASATKSSLLEAVQSGVARGAPQKVDGPGIAVDSDISEPRRVIFCPDEPLCLDDADSGSMAVAPGALCAEAPQTPAALTPATQAAATPMFSPATVFFGDGLRRQTPLLSSPSRSFFPAYAPGRDAALASSEGLCRPGAQTEPSEPGFGNYQMQDFLQDVSVLQLDDQGYARVAQHATATIMLEGARRDKECAAEKLGGQEENNEHSQLRRVIFCPDEPLCLDDAEEGSDAATAGAAVVEVLQTPVPQTPATLMAATPMFSPATAFFGDGLQRRTALPSTPSASFAQAHATGGDAVPISLDQLLFRTDLQPDLTARGLVDAESSVAEKIRGQEVAADCDRSEPQRVIFCPDEPLWLDDVEAGSAAAAAGALVAELVHTPAVQTPATQMAATPMFSPATAFFGDGRRRQAPLPGSPTAPPPWEDPCALAPQRARLPLSLGGAVCDDRPVDGADLQRVPLAPFYNGRALGNVPLQSPLCPAPTSYVEAR